MGTIFHFFRQVSGVFSAGISCWIHHLIDGFSRVDHGEKSRFFVPMENPVLMNWIQNEIPGIVWLLNHVNFHKHIYIRICKMAKKMVLSLVPWWCLHHIPRTALGWSGHSDHGFYAWWIRAVCWSYTIESHENVNHKLVILNFKEKSSWISSKYLGYGISYPIYW